MSAITVDRQKVVEATKLRLRPMVHLYLTRALAKLQGDVAREIKGPDAEGADKSIEAAIAAHCAAVFNSDRETEVTSELAGALKTCSQLLEEADKTITRLAEEAVNKVLPE